MYDYRTDLCQTDTGGVIHCSDTTFDYLINMKDAVRTYDVLFLHIPLPNADYIKVIVQASLLQFTFLHGQWQIFWLIVCAPLVIATIFGLLTWALQIFQGFLP